MNAKEISDSTLESVTPADNDLLLIYDTSEGTTGKATIAGIAQKVAENIDIATLVGDTSNLIEASALSNLGTAAGATQHEVNVEVDDAFSLLKVITKKGFSVAVPAETSTNNSWLVTVHSKEIQNNSLGAAFVARNGNTLYIFNISLITSGVMITIQEDEGNVCQIKTNYTGLNYDSLMNWNFKPMGKFEF